jgi:hypothetical protein
MSSITGHVEYLPKEDGSEYKYFEDEGKPRKVRAHSSWTNSKRLDVVLNMIPLPTEALLRIRY